MRIGAGGQHGYVEAGTWWWSLKYLATMTQILLPIESKDMFQS